MDMPIAYFGHSIVGKRENNEDNYCIERIGERYIIFAVADGMGGMAAGETASSIAIETLRRVIHEQVVENEKTDMKITLGKSYAKIQQEIDSAITVDPSLSGMGTTLISAVIDDQNKLTYANIGDSRLYLLQKGKLTQITRDHSYVQEFREKNNGVVSQHILQNYSNFLTRSLDGGNELPDIYPDDSNHLTLEEGSILLLCSDGLILNSDQEEETIKKIIIGNKILEFAARELVLNALARGSKDNITVVLFEFGRHKRSWKRYLFKKRSF